MKFSDEKLHMMQMLLAQTILTCSKSKPIKFWVCCASSQVHLREQPPESVRRKLKLIHFEPWSDGEALWSCLSLCDISDTFVFSVETLGVTTQHRFLIWAGSLGLFRTVVNQNSTLTIIKYCSRNIRMLELNQSCFFISLTPLRHGVGNVKLTYKVWTRKVFKVLIHNLV